MRGDTQQVTRGHGPEPLAVVADLAALHVQDFAHLLGVGLGVAANLLLREYGPRARAARGVADAPGEIADDEDDLVPQLLEAPQPPQGDAVPQVQVRGAGVGAVLDA